MDNVGEKAYLLAKEVEQANSELVDYVTVAGSGTGNDTYACDVAGAKAKNFALAIADTDTKIITLTNMPTGRCEVALEITTTAAATVTWTLNGGTVLGSPATSLAANKTFDVTIIKKAGETTLRVYVSAGV